MKIYVLRHGETDWNREWKLQGRTDVSLNENGIRQAEEAAADLKDMQFDVIFSSPLERARVTAETIANAKGMSVITDERLTEMSFGIYEGTTPDYEKEHPSRKLLFEAPDRYETPEGGESFEELDARCRDFLCDIKKRGYERVLVVAHGALIRGLMRAMKNLPLKDFWESGVLNNCEVKETEY